MLIEIENKQFFNNENSSREYIFQENYKQSFKKHIPHEQDLPDWALDFCTSTGATDEGAWIEIYYK